MNNAALKMHEIYNKLSGFTERELANIADYIDSLRQNKQVEEAKIIKLGGIIKDHNIDFSDLKKLKEGTWKHVDEESVSG